MNSELAFQLNRSSHHPLPGDLAMWFFILAELTAFGLLILVFLVTQALNPEAFHQSRSLLDTSTGLILTVSLMTSGFFAAMAVRAVRLQQARRASYWLSAALGSASFYVVIKWNEYSHLGAIGLDIEYDTFFSLYWILTGFHFLHVLLGLVILGFMAWRSWHGYYQADKLPNFESGVLYWHMVDLVWVMLFPTVYLMG